MKLNAAAIATFVSNLPLYVFHTKAGVRGDADLADMPGLDAFRALHDLVPGDLASWSRRNALWPDSPFRAYSVDGGGDLVEDMWPNVPGATGGATRVYSGVSDDSFFTFPMGVLGRVILEPRQNVEFDLIDPMSGQVIEHRVVDAGQQFELSGAETFVIKGLLTGLGRRHYAGSYQTGPKDFDVENPVGARHTDLAHQNDADTWVAIYTNVVAGGSHRVQVQPLRWLDSGSAWVGPGAIIEDPVAINSLEPAIVAGADGSGDMLLAIWEDARLGGGEGHREIYGQFLRADGNGDLALEGANFDISNLPGGEEFWPCAGFEPGQGFFVAWTDSREAGLREDGRVLFGRPVSSAGQLGAEVRLGDTANWQTGCAAVGGAGRFLVAWSDYVGTNRKGRVAEQDEGSSSPGGMAQYSRSHSRDQQQDQAYCYAEDDEDAVLRTKDSREQGERGSDEPEGQGQGHGQALAPGGCETSFEDA